MCTQKWLQKVAFYTFCLIKNAISSFSKVSHISPHPEKCTLEIRAGNRSTSHAICCPKECINLNVFTKNGGKKEIDLPFSVRFACFLFCFLLFLFFYFFHLNFFLSLRRGFRYWQVFCRKLWVHSRPSLNEKYEAKKKGIWNTSLSKHQRKRRWWTSWRQTTLP